MWVPVPTTTPNDFNLQMSYVTHRNRLTLAFEYSESFYLLRDSPRIEQFLEDGTNKRNDIYGSSKENRARFLLDIVEEVGAAIGKNRLARRSRSCTDIRQ